MAPGQVKRATANGVRFDWLAFDEWYGGKPEFLAALGEWGLLLYVAAAPRDLPCCPSLPKYRSLQRPSAAERADNAAVWGKPFKGRPRRRARPARKTLADPGWEVRAARVYLSRDGEPTDRTFWLVVARNRRTGAAEYFVSNAPPPHGPPDADEGRVHAGGGGARAAAGQERGRARPLRGPRLQGADAAHGAVPTGPPVRRRADRPAAGGKTPG